MSSNTHPPVVASPKVHALLQKLHALSSAQEKSWSQSYFYFSRVLRYYVFGETWASASDDHMRDKFVALEEDKCQFIYLLARAMGVRNVVEAGTSFGVSTIYLALAVGQNVTQERKMRGGEVKGKVIATEKEPSKASRAREHWKEAGEEVEPWIELREGDLLETLKVEEGMPGEVDMLLLDSTLSYCVKLNGSLLIIYSLDTARSSYTQNHTAAVETGGGYYCRQYFVIQGLVQRSL
jgi:hypothetical protein